MDEGEFVSLLGGNTEIFAGVEAALLSSRDERRDLIGRWTGKLCNMGGNRIDALNVNVYRTENITGSSCRDSVPHRLFDWAVRKLRIDISV